MFKIGSSVYAVDGPVGKLQYVVLNPHTREVSDLVVKCDPFTGSRVVSARYIDHVDDDGSIHLTVDKDFVRRTRKFDHKEFVTVTDDGGVGSEQLFWQDLYGLAAPEAPKPVSKVHIDRGLNEEDVLVGKGSRVYTALGERVGVVDHVVIDHDAHELLYLVVRLPGIRRRRVIVAASQVKEWEHDAVVLNLDRDALASLPPYVPSKHDATVAQLVRQAIAALGVDVENLGVFVDRGHVLLRGHASTQDDRRRVEAATRSVSGVLSVSNEITTDRELEMRAQQRLLADPVASLYPVDVIVKNRIATVIGKVPSTAVQDVILEIVRNTPGIVSAIDEISVDALAFADEEFPARLVATGKNSVPVTLPATQEP